MTRIPRATRDSIPEEQRTTFDEFVQQRGSVPSTCPFSIMINVPEIMQRGEHLRAYLRSDASSLPL